jgi:glutathione synthase/RimK-type ligase-like ATP-grasp enzyme
MITITPLHNDVNSRDVKKTFIGKFMSILELNKIDYKLIPFYNQKEFWDSINKSSHFIARYRGTEKDLSLMQAILPEIERNGVYALPNFNTAYHCGDKSRLAPFYEANNINHPKTYLFWEIEHVISVLDSGSIVFPVIVKLRRGASSTNVIKVNNKKQLLKLAKNIFLKGVKPGMLEEAAYGSGYFLSLILKSLKKQSAQSIKDLRHKLHYIRLNDTREIESSCLIVQQYHPNNSFDTRITIIGDRAFGFRRFNRKDDFRASGSGLIDYDTNEIDSSMIKLAFELSKKFDFQTMAYDFIYDTEGNPTVLEHNFTYVDSAVSKCPIYWDQDLNEFPNDNKYPQYWQLVDALGDNKLKSI